MRVLVAVLLLSAIFASSSAQYHDAFCDGKTVIVHLFEWKWSDIAAECERFLAAAGFCGVQVSPPNEHILKPDEGYPWWERYQPISYILESRSGNEDEFRDMVSRCNAVGVRIIVDVVFNHMAGVGQSGTGSGGSSFDSDSLSFPGVPYGSNDFTPRSMCPSSDGGIHDYNNAEEVRNCYLTGLTDLYQGEDYVRQEIAGYLNNLISIGVMGFRVDASKHMWPGDISIIESYVNDLSTDAGFPSGSRPFFYHEVIDNGGEAISVDEYYDLGRVTEFRYCHNIRTGIYDFSQLGAVYRPEDGMCTYENAFIFVDNHDNQRSDSSVLTYKNGRDYSNAVVYTLAQDYGFARIMSSYDFSYSDQGPPSDGSGNTNDVTINADGSCGGGWICEHRWASISRMPRFRNAAGDTYKDNWYSDGSTVAFSRGSNAFFAINVDGNLNQNFQTGMPAGDYCDIITNCAKTVTVNSDGTANIVIDSYDDPFVAICQGCGALDV
ncbi:UNVERIFIED_CONTAM: hypothetical protein RMT77_001854 [Armadillidium vulgare]